MRDREGDGGSETARQRQRERARGKREGEEKEQLQRVCNQLHPISVLALFMVTLPIALLSNPLITISLLFATDHIDLVV